MECEKWVDKGHLAATTSALCSLSLQLVCAIPLQYKVLSPFNVHPLASS